MYYLFSFHLISLQVYDFFQKRIEELYPLDPSPTDPLQIQKEAHEVFITTISLFSPFLLMQLFGQIWKSSPTFHHYVLRKKKR